MKTLRILAMAIPVLCFVNMPAAPCNAATPKGGAAPKAETFVVVKVGDDIRVVPTATLKTEKKKTEDEDKAAQQKYSEDKKAAAKNKEKFDQPKPVNRKFTTLKAGLKSQQEATDWMEKYKANPNFEKKTAAG
jgi:hypothetical protein